MTRLQNMSFFFFRNPVNHFSSTSRIAGCLRMAALSEGGRLRIRVSVTTRPGRSRSMTQTDMVSIFLEAPVSGACLLPASPHLLHAWPPLSFRTGAKCERGMCDLEASFRVPLSMHIGAKHNLKERNGCFSLVAFLVAVSIPRPRLLSAAWLGVGRAELGARGDGYLQYSQARADTHTRPTPLQPTPPHVNPPDSSQTSDSTQTPQRRSAPQV